MGNYAALIHLNQECKDDLHWWIGNIESVQKKIIVPDPQWVFETDASKTGWGGCLVNQGEKVSTGGNWDALESEEHINLLEIKAAWFTIKSFCGNVKNAHIKILTDNTTAVAYLNEQGGTKKKCNELTNEIWTWCYTLGNWITATHLPGSQNVTADSESRSIHDNMEWKLNTMIFDKICSLWGTPEVDLFASRLNHQTDKYLSWKPDPFAFAVDAMTERWSDWFFYAFPPFNMLGRVLQKVQIDQCKGIVIVPYWPTQHWFSKFTQMCLCPPRCIFSRPEMPALCHPWRDAADLPVRTLLVGLISGLPSNKWTSPKDQGGYFWHPTDLELKNSTTLTSRSGIDIVVRGVMTHCPPL